MIGYFVSHPAGIAEDPGVSWMAFSSVRPVITCRATVP